MKNKLPSDLKEAESNVYESIQNYFLSNSEQSFLSINLKFDGLRLNPIIFRLSNKLKEINYDNILLWADAGGAALAKRDNPELANKIFTFKEFINSKDCNDLNIIFETEVISSFEIHGPIVILNPDS